MRYRERASTLELLSNVLRVILVSCLFVVLYFVLAAFISTDTESAAREIALTRPIEYFSAKQTSRKSIAARSKDNEIYKNVFHNGLER